MSDCCKNQSGKRHIAIVGSGSAAFSAAIKAVELGARVSMIEASGTLGGTCVNVGCVPSKVMIQGAKTAWQSRHHPFDGLQCRKLTVDRQRMVAQQQSLVRQLRHDKYESILQANPDIQLVRGKASFSDADTLRIDRSDGNRQSLRADRYLLAVGSRPAIPAIDGLEATPFWTSTQALVDDHLPRHLVVLGGSVVALELAQAFLHLGSKVTLLARSTLLSKQDDDLGAGLKPLLEAEGMDIRLHTVPTSVSHDGNEFTVNTTQESLRCDRLLVATGRRSNADTLAPEKAGIATDRHGGIIIDDHMQTCVPHIYAAGDCTTLPRYVYVAAAAGSRAARNMLGENTALDLATMPAVVFTSPQVASVGLTRLQAATRGIETDSRSLPLRNVPRALANMDTRGFIKLVAESGSGRLLGCQVLAEQAGEIIQTAALAIRQQMTVSELGEQLYPYLTMVEGLKLAAQTFHRDIEQLSCCAG